jgi:hypothetical protein
MDEYDMALVPLTEYECDMDTIQYGSQCIQIQFQTQKRNVM